MKCCCCCCSLFRVNPEEEAKKQFNNLSYKLQALLSGSSGRMLNRDQLQQFLDLVRAKPGWTCAHLAVKLKLMECFSADIVAQLVLQLADFLSYKTASAIDIFCILAFYVHL